MLISDQLCLLVGRPDESAVEGLERESKGDLLGVVAGGGSEVSDDPSPRSIGGVAGRGEWALTLPTSADRGPLAFRLMAFWRLTLPLPGAGVPMALTSTSPETVREPWCSAYWRR